MKIFSRDERRLGLKGEPISFDAFEKGGFLNIPRLVEKLKMGKKPFVVATYVGRTIFRPREDLVRQLEEILLEETLKVLGGKRSP